jgi:hypothetical protein
MLGDAVQYFEMADFSEVQLRDTATNQLFLFDDIDPDVVENQTGDDIGNFLDGGDFIQHQDEAEAA